MNTENNKEALEYLVETGKKLADGKLLYEDDTKQIFGLRDENGQICVHELLKPYKTNHQFNSIDSVVNFLSSKFVKSQDTLLFISRDGLEIARNYNYNNFEKAMMRFRLCPEFELIKKFAHGIDQVKLLKHLQTDLNGCIDGRLHSILSAIQIKNKSESAVEILPCGLSEMGTIQKMNITFPKARGEGTEDKELQLDWDYEGPVIEGFDVNFTANLRLYIEFTPERGLVFTFKIVREEAFFRDVLESIVEQISSNIPEKMEIYEGKFLAEPF